MRPVMAMLGVVAAIVSAASAYGDPAADDPPTADNPAFLASLQRAGISYNDPDQVIAAGQAVCGLVADGKSGLEVLRGLMTANPGFTTDGAAQFAAISASVYCPHQLSSDNANSQNSDF